MKACFRKLFVLMACAIGLAGCSALGDLPATAVGAVAAVVGPSAPSTGYTAYLAHCAKEVEAQRQAINADNAALQAGLQSDNEKTQFGSLILLATKSGSTGPRIGCTVDREPGTVELFLGKGDIVDKGLRLYQINRDEKRFTRQLEANKELAESQMAHDRQMRAQNNDLLTTLTGDKLQLQNSTQDDGYRRAQLPPPVVAP